MEFVLGASLFFFLLFAFIVAMRYISYRETIYLAEKGLLKSKNGGQRESNGNGKPGYALLRWGIIIAGLGLAITIGLWPLGLTFRGDAFPLGLGPWMLFGFIPLFFGLALVLVHILTRGESSGQPARPAEPLTPLETPAPLKDEESK